MGYGRKRYERKSVGSSTFGLNITSMTDMFTILLVFLLQTYSTSDVQIIPEKGVKLPIANAEANPVKSIQVSLSSTELKLEGKTVASLQNSDFARPDIDPNDTNFILPLFKALEKANKDMQAKRLAASPAVPGAATPVAKVDDPPEETGRILLMADEALPYQVLRKVMYTASMAGFPKLKLATVVGN
jgi:biopolymer transport protein ExbD